MVRAFLEMSHPDDMCPHRALTTGGSAGGSAAAHALMRRASDGDLVPGQSWLCEEPQGTCLSVLMASVLHQGMLLLTEERSFRRVRLLLNVSTGNRPFHLLCASREFSDEWTWCVFLVGEVVPLWSVRDSVLGFFFQAQTWWYSQTFLCALHSLRMGCKMKRVPVVSCHHCVEQRSQCVRGVDNVTMVVRVMCAHGGLGACWWIRTCLLVTRNHE